MHYCTSAVFSITLFGFLSSLVCNNRIENLKLINNNKISGAPYFRGALRQCLFCLQVAPALVVDLLPDSGPSIKVKCGTRLRGQGSRQQEFLRKQAPRDKTKAQ